MPEKLENIVSQKSYEALHRVRQRAVINAERANHLGKILGIDPKESDLETLETLNIIREGQNFRPDPKASSPRVAAQKEIRKIWP